MHKNTFTYALPNSKETRAGARTCLCAIRQVTNLVDFKNLKEDTRAQVFRNRDAAAQIMLDAIGGNLSQFQTGFMLFLAEHIDDCVTHDNQSPDFSKLNKSDGWNPESIRTKKQIEAMRKEYSDSFDEFMSEENNVISLCAFRNK